MGEGIGFSRLKFENLGCKRGRSNFGIRNMKAVAVFPTKREVRLIDREAPRVEKSTQVRIRMLDVGICGTDKEICAFLYGNAPPDSEYLILGHESLGEVVEVGSAVSRVKPGDLVIIMVRRP